MMLLVKRATVPTSSVHRAHHGPNRSSASAATMTIAQTQWWLHETGDTSRIGRASVAMAGSTSPSDHSRVAAQRHSARTDTANTAHTGLLPPGWVSRVITPFSDWLLT